MLSFNNNKNGRYQIICKNSGNIVLEKNYADNLLHGEYIYYWDNDSTTKKIIIKDNDSDSPSYEKYVIGEI